MKSTKDIKVSYTESYIDRIKCDICFKNILKMTDDYGYVDYAVLTMMTVHKDSLQKNGIRDDEMFAKESSDICRECYTKIVKILKKSMNAKIPSYYFNGIDEEELETEMITTLLFDEDEEEDEEWDEEEEEDGELEIEI